MSRKSAARRRIITYPGFDESLPVFCELCSALFPTYTRFLMHCGKIHTQITMSIAYKETAQTDAATIHVAEQHQTAVPVVADTDGLSIIPASDNRDVGIGAPAAAVSPTAATAAKLTASTGDARVDASGETLEKLARAAKMAKSAEVQRTQGEQSTTTTMTTKMPMQAVASEAKKATDKQQAPPPPPQPQQQQDLRQQGPQQEQLLLQRQMMVTVNSLSATLREMDLAVRQIRETIHDVATKREREKLDAAQNLALYKNSVVQFESAILKFTEQRRRFDATQTTFDPIMQKTLELVYAKIGRYAVELDAATATATATALLRLQPNDKRIRTPNASRSARARTRQSETADTRRATNRPPRFAARQPTAASLR